MAMKQNAVTCSHKYPQASQAVLKSFYVDDGLGGTDTIKESIQLRVDLQNLFKLGGFHLRKWKSNELDVLSTIPSDLVDPKTMQELMYKDDYTKILGVEWNAASDNF